MNFQSLSMLGLIKSLCHGVWSWTSIWPMSTVPHPPQITHHSLASCNSHDCCKRGQKNLWCVPAAYWDRPRMLAVFPLSRKYWGLLFEMSRYFQKYVQQISRYRGKQKKQTKPKSIDADRWTWWKNLLPYLLLVMDVPSKMSDKQSNWTHGAGVNTHNCLQTFPSNVSLCDLSMGSLDRQ